ncbi:glycine--tRNA ligase subunit beta [Solemya velesiana gill symbiont]|uniref:Glycine--tRNA ligase beta subunit n=1 Tax=Solemya velesiana gill symbiont TaxID=1918948 RepID=A0A1T2KXG7_9GAMM|nr:glycine--tRNA ligase subunit beta [Solemya velesiana gill symbiont]OOZ37545.1 glycine--tRNA ligase subunit beta [Solemya velesiana gill symbiont]
MADRADLLFELGTEELPPVALKRLSDALTREFVAGLESADIAYGEVKSFAAPRRLGILITDCATGQPDKDVERRGPAVKAAFDADGNATKAAEGFARSCGTTVDQLQRIETEKGGWLTYKVHQTGKPAAELLPGIAETALNKLPIPKRMRWGASEAQFVRPVHWLLFLHGDQVVPCSILDAEAGNLTYGHRFHHPGSLQIGKPAEYADKLEAQGYVIADFSVRREKIRNHVMQTAETLGGSADMDDDLLDEVTALNEWPVPIAGAFEEKYLVVPHEALVYTMKLNQKYFPMFDANGGLMNHFITIANIDSPKPELIKEGNERVVRPRLSDAMFFWTQDGKKRLEDHQESLKRVVFQQKLGSMYEKSQRVAALASNIAGQIDGETTTAHRAGMLSRCDLMTEMVYEFPAMQGIMGRYQAARDGEPEELGQAMDEFYMPRYSGDQLPQTKTGIAISLAERLDTLVGIFGIGMKPTGDKDPFALRRAALGALRIMQEHALPVNLGELLQQTADGLGDKISEADVVADVYDFMIERLKGLYHERAIAANVFEAVAAVRPESTADFDRRINAVVAFENLPQAESLAAANKRIRNILKKVDGETPDQVDPTLFEGDEERALHDQVTAMANLVNPMLEQYDYEGSLIALADLKEPVDRFFDEVMVMADDQAIRNNRIVLLNQLSGLFLGVADISRLQS